jgi:hypothetical protein
MRNHRFVSLGLLSLSLGLAACNDDTSSITNDETGTESGDGDGDGDPSGDGDGDGDGDPSGDGDGDPSGDGDGDPTGDGDGDPTGDGDGDPDDAEIRVLHLGVDAPAVDIYVNGSETPAIEDLAFTDGTGYIPLPPATYTVDIAPADTSLAASVFQIDVDLAAQTSYSAVANGRLADASFGVGAFIDDADDIDAGDTRLRVTHYAPAVGQVDIYNLADDSVLLADVDYGGSAVLDVPAGAYRLGVDVDDDAVYDLVFSVPDLGGGNLVNVYATNEEPGADSGRVFLLAHLPDGSTARVDADPKLRALHLGVGAPAVDVFVNDDPTPVVTNLAFTEGTGYLDVPPGAYKIDVAPTGDGIGAAINLATDLALAAGTKYTAAAVDTLADLAGLALVDDDLGIAADQIRLQVVHAAPGVGEVDIWELSGPAMLLEDVPFTGSGVLDLPVGAYEIGIDVDNDAVPDLAFAIPELPGGSLYNVYAANEAGGAVFLLAQLPDGSTVRIDPNPCLLGPVWFADRGEFDLLSPNAVLEDFEGSNAVADALLQCLAPVSAVENACYDTGEIIDGVTFDSFPTGNALAVAPPELGVNPTSVVVVQDAANGLSASFAGPTNRVGFDLWSVLIDSTMAVTAYGEDDVVLATADIEANTLAPVFVGLCTPNAITRVEVLTVATAEAVDDFAFGNE